MENKAIEYALENGTVKMVDGKVWSLMARIQPDGSYKTLCGDVMESYDMEGYIAGGLPGGIELVKDEAGDVWSLMNIPGL